MKRHTLMLCAGAMCLAFSANGQTPVNTVGDVVRIVLDNSPLMNAAKGSYQLESLESRSVRLLENPEFELENVWAEGHDDSFGREIRLTQSFDFASLSGMKGRLASSMENLSSKRLEAETVEIASMARELCARIIYSNRMIEALTEYNANIDDLYKSTLHKEQSGEGTALDKGKARIQLSQTSARLRRAVMERDVLIARLRTLAGREDLDFHGTIFPEYGGPDDFASWFEKAKEENPLLGMAQNGIQVREMELKINKSAWAPQLKMGYLYEAERDAKSRGLIVGISLPLWSNANKVKSSAAALNVARDTRLQQENEFRMNAFNAWNNAAGYRDIAAESRMALSESDNRALLGKALAAGEISLLEYILESSLYYDALEATLSAELDYNLALCELLRFGGVTE